MFPARQKYIINHIFNGPHTIVSTMPNGYSITTTDIKITDCEPQAEESCWDDITNRDLEPLLNEAY